MDQFLTEIGKYKIESHLGRGAFGIVYKCVNKDTKEVVAVKTLRKMTKASQKLMKSEIEVLQSIDCVNVVKMIESFTNKLPYDHQDYEFLVMEYCDSNLLDYVFNKKNHVLEEKEALEIFAQILNGFQSIHEKGIMHRDLKLENVLIKNGVVKIADFGLAKKMESLTSNEHLTRSFCGTKAYLAPEVLSGNYYDYKVDIWSLGVLLFVMLFFKFPFGSRQDNPLELLKRIQACCEKQPFDVDTFIERNFSNRTSVSSGKEKEVNNKLQGDQKLLDGKQQVQIDQNKQQIQQQNNQLLHNHDQQNNQREQYNNNGELHNQNGDDYNNNMNKNEQQNNIIKNEQQNNKGEKERKQNKVFVISDEVKDLFKRIFVVKPEERIGFEDLLKHAAFKRCQTENIEQHIDFYGNTFPTLFKYQSEIQIKSHHIKNRSENGEYNDNELNKEMKGEVEKDDNIDDDESYPNEDKMKRRNKQNQITTGQMSNIMMARGSTIRFNMKNSSQFRTHIMIYNHLICRYQMLTIAYQQVQQGWFIDLLGQKDYTVLKYFLLKATIYYLQNLVKYLTDAENSFGLKDWPSFVISKPYKNILSQISQDCKKWLPEYHLLSEEVQEYEYDSEDIKKGVYESIPIDVEMDVYIESLPTNLKLPFRAVVLTVFSKVYEYAGKCFQKMGDIELQLKRIKESQFNKQSTQSSNTSSRSNSRNKYNSPINKNQNVKQQQNNNSNQIYNSNFNKPINNNKSKSTQFNLNSISRNTSSTSHSNSIQTNTSSLQSNQSTAQSMYSQKLLTLKISYEEQFGIKSIRMALLLISCGVINRIFEVPSCIIRLREFQPQEINYNAESQQQTFRFEELVEWFYQVPKDKAYKQIQLIVNSYFKQISSQLCVNQDLPFLDNQFKPQVTPILNNQTNKSPPRKQYTTQNTNIKQTQNKLQQKIIKPA